jgi:hypothetical protein
MSNAEIRSDIVERLRERKDIGNGLSLPPTDLEIEAATEIEHVRARRHALRKALASLRACVKEGGVPRYAVTPGAALNSIIEEVVDPVLRAEGK